MNVGPLEDEIRELIIWNTEMVETQNQYFASVFMVEDTSTIPTVTGNTEVIEREELRTIIINREMVLNKLL